MNPQIRWSTLSPAAALGILAIGVIVILALPQVVAVLVTSSLLQVAITRPSFTVILGLWGQPDVAWLYGTNASGVHWGIAVTVLLLLVAALLLVGWRLYLRSQNPQFTKGLASVYEAVDELGEKQLVKKYGPMLRRSLKPHMIRPEHVGYKVGIFQSIKLWIRAEDPAIIIGPSRSGKGWYLILNWILSAPGAVITTSSKMDNAQLTCLARERAGSHVWIFAPGIAGGESLNRVLRWNPIDGCVDEETLVRRVKSLIPSDSFSGNTSNGGHWDTLGQQLAAHLFHAAACANKDVDTLWEWVGSPERARNAVHAIREHSDGLLEHANHLEEVINLPPEQRATQWGVLPTVLAFMESRSARKWMKPDVASTMNMVEFVLGRGTLYLIGDRTTSAGYVRIIDGLLAELDFVTKGLADASPGARLDPPVTYLLDEAANFKYQGLPELITAGGGRGRVGVAVFQSKGQLAEWGEQHSGTLWDASVAKILLPGGGDPEELRRFSDLVGEIYVNRESHSFGSQFTPNVQVSQERRAVLLPNQIRELKKGYAVFFYRHLKPIIPKLIGIDEHPEYEQLKADAAQLAETMQTTSPFAESIREFRGN